jgi:Zn-dependent peptidase ImmA (M78 family)/transcriptional regulator with XRE-family HTH domain
MSAWPDKKVFVPARLTAARKRHASTIAALAVESGISTKSLSDYENAKKEPSQETLRKIADTLEVRLDYFMRAPLDEVPPDAISFRAPSKMPKRNKDMALAIASHAMELRTWIDRHFETPPVDVPTLHKFTAVPDGPAQAASVLRARWGLGEAPAGNMIHLLELHGVAVFSAKTHKNDVLDAFSFRADDRPFVLLCTTKSAERGRFDAAHELGHLVLHGETAEAPGPSAEREADAFASEFLMPEADVRAQMRMNPPLDQILKKKHRWGVAAIALAYRLHDLGLLSDWLYHTTCVNLSRMGYKSGEPNGKIERESSRLLGLVMSDLLTRARGFEGLCRDLSVTPSGINSLMFNLAPLVLEGERQTSMPTRPELHLIQGELSEE